MQPNARLIMITPICAHTLTQRSIIFGQDDEIVIQINDNKKEHYDMPHFYFNGKSAALF